MTETIVLGGGCFWCTETIYNRTKGVISVKPGYAGGTTPHPTYEMVTTGLTGHAEVVAVEYNPKIINLADILDIFWEVHDPTSLNKQGNDEGTQYRSIILYNTKAQQTIINESIKKLNKPIVTEIKPLIKFYPAENYHEKYFENHADQPYCKIVILPKVSHFENIFNKFIKME